VRGLAFPKVSEYVLVSLSCLSSLLSSTPPSFPTHRLHGTESEASIFWADGSCGTSRFLWRRGHKNFSLRRVHELELELLDVFLDAGMEGEGVRNEG
jgi:hypothetical protein